jgi:hypothetical protein
MYNSNWEAKKDTITGLDLYRVDNVIKYMHDLREFILTTAGKLSDSRAPVLKPDYMPSRDTRFPEDTMFLCEGYGEWSQYHHQLRLCVNVMLNRNRLERSYSNYSTSGQTEETALEIIGQIFGAIYDNSICMDRGTFEHHYCLEWYFPESPQPRLQNRDHMNELMEKVRNASDRSNGDLQQEKESDDDEDSKENEGSSM